MANRRYEQPAPPRAAAMGQGERDILTVLQNQYQAADQESEDIAAATTALGILAALGQARVHPAAGCPRCMSAVCCCVTAAECCEDARQPETSACEAILKKTAGFFCGLFGLPQCCCLTACCCGCCDKIEPTERVKAGYLPPSLRS